MNAIAARSLATALTFGAINMVRYMGADRLSATNDGATFTIEFDLHTGAARLDNGYVLTGALARMAATARDCIRAGR